MSLTATEAALLLALGSTESVVSSCIRAVVVTCLGCFPGSAMGVATRREVTLSPAARVVYSQAGVSGLVPLAHVREMSCKRNEVCNVSVHGSRLLMIAARPTGK